MGFLRRLFGKGTPGPDAAPGDLLDYLEARRAAAEKKMLRRYRLCPECKSDYLRLGAWTKGGEAGWTVTCVNCGHLLTRTTEVRAK